jgi:prepilin-type N-terminal cleavage/methylation domain-containing protein/prepilin-type processing-associated H-X9-DG protein
MQPRFSNQRNSALTLIEVLVVIAILAFVTFLYLPSFLDRPHPAHRINCVNNLKEIGLAYKLWAGDNNDKFPMQVSITDTNGGGAMELAATGNVVATFQIMSNELSTPRLLYCTADKDHTWATNFTTGFSAKNISYFVGVDADQAHPQMLLSGDDNFQIGGVPVKSGFLQLSTNTPIFWTAARHKHAGNIGYADGSVQQVTTVGLQQSVWQTGVATNRLAIP